MINGSLVGTCVRHSFDIIGVGRAQLIDYLCSESSKVDSVPIDLIDEVVHEEASGGRMQTGMPEVLTRVTRLALGEFSCLRWYVVMSLTRDRRIWRHRF